MAKDPPRPGSRRGRGFAAAALLCLCGTFLAAQIDYFRRHRPGISPRRYWAPQVEQVWAPGLAATGVLAAIAGALAWRRRDDGTSARKD